MDERVKHLIEDVQATYKDVVTGNGSRIQGGNVLWDHFKAAADACRMNAKDGERRLHECINEFAVAKQLADDKFICGSIAYEPNLLPSNRKIDFAADRLRDKLYVEVKTVNPYRADTEKAWSRYCELRKHHSPLANFMIHKDWMGGKLYGEAFASRSKFLEYAKAFEERLAEAKKIKEGSGVLVFCRNSIGWHCSELEDFADFYHSGKHRTDDKFALMEEFELKQKSTNLLRNIDHFAYLSRPVDKASVEDFRFPVRGP